MSRPTANDGHVWVPAWAQAVSDFRGEDDEPGFDNVTIRMTAPAGFGGERVRAELSNRFGDGPVVIRRAAIGVAEQFVAATFDRQPSVTIPAGETRWTDPNPLTIEHGDEILIDVYLPDPTPYATAGGFRFDRSLRGDYVGAVPFPVEGSAPAAVDEEREFPAPNTGTEPESEAGADGTGWSLPAGGPFLRTIEVAGIPARAVIVGLGGSSTAMGWPQYAAAQLSPDLRVAVVNRGISGNRIRLDAPPQTPSWGQAGLTRFDDDVLGTAGATHVVIAYNSNDWGLPGRVTSIDEMPTLPQLINGYQELIDRSETAGLRVVLATITPLAPELLADADREDLRSGLNEWIRGSGHHVVDFDAAIRSETAPSRIEPTYAAPDDTHPNVNGEKRLAQVVVDVVATQL